MGRGDNNNIVIVSPAESKGKFVHCPMSDQPSLDPFDPGFVIWQMILNRLEQLMVAEPFLIAGRLVNCFHRGGGSLATKAACS
jgi:hypothetical protein